jgi:hypothetical protein
MRISAGRGVCQAVSERHHQRFAGRHVSESRLLKIKFFANCKRWPDFSSRPPGDRECRHFPGRSTLHDIIDDESNAWNELCRHHKNQATARIKNPDDFCEVRFTVRA